MIALEHFRVSWRELLDIAIVAFIFYRGLLLIKGTRAVSILYGFILILAVFYLSGELGLYTLNWLLTNFLGSVFLVVIILFQADIRKVLSRMGAGRIWRRVGRTEAAEEVLREIILAVFRLARGRVGALIVLERDVPLGDIAQRGVELSARLSKELLLTLFYPGTALHDGAALVRGEKLAAAGCILPLAAGVNLDAELGTRHRAAMGITEESDAVAVVVSEERGQVSLAVGGELSGPMDEIGLKDRLWELWGKRL